MRTEYPATWFRLYAEFATDPKVQMLSEPDQRRYLMLLCLRCSNGDVTLHDEEIAFQLRVTGDEWDATKSRLMSKTLIDENNKPVAWNRRQRESDSSAERVAKHRALHKKACNGDVTLQQRQVETETETETETEKPKAIGAPASIPPASPPADTTATEKPNSRGTRLPDDWVLPKKWGDEALAIRPDWSAEKVRGVSERFRDYWLANANQRNAKKSDWLAAWRNWVRSTDDRASPAKPSPHKLPTPGTGAYGVTTPLTAAQEAELERLNAIDPVF